MRQHPFKEGCDAVRDKLNEFGEQILSRGGAILSYTEDSIIAFFNAELSDENAELSDELDAGAARNALRTIQEMKNLIDPQISLRVALHYGNVYMPTGESPANQPIGHDVFCATRLCHWIAQTIEPAIPRSHRGMIIGATREFYELNRPEFLREWGHVEFKEQPDPHLIYIDKNYLPGSSS